MEGNRRPGKDLALSKPLSSGARRSPPCPAAPRRSLGEGGIEAEGLGLLQLPSGKTPDWPPKRLTLVEYADFQKIQFRTAKILAAEKVAGADKLLKLQIDVGGETRQLVAGIALHYAPESLPGKTVVVVANLKPATIRGVESRGMLLAASVGKELRLVTVEGDLPSGAVVK